jgi:hypothetical protein
MRREKDETQDMESGLVGVVAGVGSRLSGGDGRAGTGHLQSERFCSNFSRFQCSAPEEIVSIV